MQVINSGSSKSLLAKSHTGWKPIVLRILWPRQHKLGTVTHASRRKDAEGGKRRTPKSPHDGSNSENDGEYDGSDADGNSGGQKSKYGAQLYGSSDFGIMDDTDPDSAAIAEFVRAKQRAATRRARLGAPTAVHPRDVSLQDYLATQGLGSISHFRELVEQEAQRTIEELKETDLAALEVQVEAQGGNLQADWAALESARSTTGLSKSEPEVRGISKGAPLPDDTLLAPPSNPRVDRLRAKSQQMRRKRRLFDPVDGDGSMYDDPPSGSGSDEEGTAAFDYLPQYSPEDRGRDTLLRRPTSSGRSKAPASRSSQLPLPPTANPFLSLPRRPSNARDPSNDVDAILDRMMDTDLAALQQQLRADDKDDRYDDDGYDEYGNRRPGAVDAAAANDDYSDRMRALPGALTEKPERGGGMESLAMRPARLVAGSDRKGQDARGPAGSGAVSRLLAAVPDDYDALAEILESVGEELEQQGAASSGLSDLLNNEGDAVYCKTAPPRGTRSFTTTELWRIQMPPSAPPRPQLLGRPTTSAEASNAGVRAATSSASGYTFTARPFMQSAFADSDAELLEELLSDDSFLSNLDVEVGSAQWRESLGGDGDRPQPLAAPNSPRLPTLESKPTARLHTAGMSSAAPNITASTSTGNYGTGGVGAAGDGGDKARSSPAASLAQSQRDQEELLLEDGDLDLDNLDDQLSNFDYDTGIGSEPSLLRLGGSKQPVDLGVEAAKPVPKLLDRPFKHVQGGPAGRAGLGGGMSRGSSSNAGTARTVRSAALGEKELDEMQRCLSELEDRGGVEAMLSDKAWEGHPAVETVATMKATLPTAPLARPVRGGSSGSGTSAKVAQRSVPLVSTMSTDGGSALPSAHQPRAVEVAAQVSAVAPKSERAATAGGEWSGAGLRFTMGPGASSSVEVSDASYPSLKSQEVALPLTSAAASTPALAAGTAPAPTAQPAGMAPADEVWQADPKPSAVPTLSLEEALAVLSNPLRTAALTRLEGKPLLSSLPPRGPYASKFDTSPSSSNSSSFDAKNQIDSSNKTWKSSPALGREQTPAPARVAKAKKKRGQDISIDMALQLQWEQARERSIALDTSTTVAASIPDVKPQGADATDEGVATEGVGVRHEAADTAPLKSPEELAAKAAAAAAILLDARKAGTLRGYRPASVNPERPAAAVPPSRLAAGTSALSSLSPSVSASMAAMAPTVMQLRLTEASEVQDNPVSISEPVTVGALEPKVRTWTRTPAVRPWRPGRAPLSAPSVTDPAKAQALSSPSPASSSLSTASRNTLRCTETAAPARPFSMPALAVSTSTPALARVPATTQLATRQKRFRWDGTLQLGAPPASRRAELSKVASPAVSGTGTTASSVPLILSDRLRRVRLMIMRGEIVEGVFAASAGPSGPVVFPKLASLGVVQPVVIRVGRLLGRRETYVIGPQEAIAARLPVAAGLEVGSSGPQVLDSDRARDPVVLSGMPQESAAAAPAASDRVRKQHLRRIWAAVTSVRLVSKDTAQLPATFAPSGETDRATEETLAAPRSGGRRGGSSVASVPADLEVEVVEVLKPARQRWNSLTHSLRRQVLDMNRGRVVTATLVAITERGAYCELKLEVPDTPPPQVLGAEEAAGFGCEQKLLSGAEDAKVLDLDLAVGEAIADEKLGCPGATLYSQLCFLPVECMAVSLVADWPAIIRADESSRIRAWNFATSVFDPLAEPLQCIRIVRPGDLLECRVEGSLITPVSVLMGLLAQAPHRAGQKLLEALDFAASDRASPKCLEEQGLAVPNFEPTANGSAAVANVGADIDALPDGLLRGWSGATEEAAYSRRYRRLVTTNTRPAAPDVDADAAEPPNKFAADGGPTARVRAIVEGADAVYGQAGSVSTSRSVVLALEILEENPRGSDEHSSNSNESGAKVYQGVAQQVPPSTRLVHGLVSDSAVERVSVTSWVPFPRKRGRPYAHEPLAGTREPTERGQDRHQCPSTDLSTHPFTSGSGSGSSRAGLFSAHTASHLQPHVQQDSRQHRTVAGYPHPSPPLRPSPQPSSLHGILRTTPTTLTQATPDSSARGGHSGVDGGILDPDVERINNTPAFANYAATSVHIFSRAPPSALGAWSWDPVLQFDAPPASRTTAAATAATTIAVSAARTVATTSVGTSSTEGSPGAERFLLQNVTYAEQLKRIRLMVIRGDLVEGHIQGPYDATRRAVPANFPTLSKLGVAQPVWIAAGNLLDWRKDLPNEVNTGSMVVAAVIDDGNRVAEKVTRGADMMVSEALLEGEEVAPAHTGAESGRINGPAALGRRNWPLMRIWVAVTSMRAVSQEGMKLTSQGQGHSLASRPTTVTADVQEDASAVDVASAPNAGAAGTPDANANKFPADFVVQVEEVIPPKLHRWASGYSAVRRQVINSSRGRQVDTHVLSITERGVYCELQLEAPGRRGDRPRGLESPSSQQGGKSTGGSESGVAAGPGSDTDVSLHARAGEADASLLIHQQLAFLPRESLAAPLAAAWPDMVALEKGLRARAIARRVGDSALLVELLTHRKFVPRSEHMQMGDVLEARVEFAITCVSVSQFPVLAVLSQASYHTTPELLRALDLPLPESAATSVMLSPDNPTGEAAAVEGLARGGGGPESSYVIANPTAGVAPVAVPGAGEKT